MKKEIADKWIKALRSGKYKQGRGRLNYHDKELCCLGVLCEVALSEGLDISKELETDADGTLSVYSYDENPHYLPESIIKWADIKPCDNDRSFLAEMVSMNDDQDSTFHEIAELIGKNQQHI